MRIHIKKLNQAGFDHATVVVVFVVLFALVGSYFLYKSLAATPSVLKLQLDTGLCMDNYGDSSASHQPVSIYSCKSTDQAEHWTLKTVSGNNFLLQTTAHDGKTVCADDTGDGVSKPSQNGKPPVRVYLQTYSCNSADHAQVWHWTGSSAPGQIQNAYNDGCINDPANSKTSGTQLIVYPCSPAASNSRWYQSAAPSAGGGSNGGGGTSLSCSHTGVVGQDIANCAETQLAYWNAHPTQHSALIARYCDNNSACMAGEWCAGFTSYVLGVSGYSVGEHFLAYDYKSLANYFNFTSHPSIGAVMVSSGAGGAGHVGIVVSTNPVTTISGNYANAVVKTTDTSGYVYGYAARK